MWARRNFKKYIRPPVLDGAQVRLSNSNLLSKCGEHTFFPLICRSFKSLLCIFVAIQPFTVCVISPNESYIGANGEWTILAKTNALKDKKHMTLFSFYNGRDYSSSTKMCNIRCLWLFAFSASVWLCKSFVHNVWVCRIRIVLYI